MKKQKEDLVSLSADRLCLVQQKYILGFEMVVLLKSEKQLHFISYLQVFLAVLISNRAIKKPLSFCSRLKEVGTHRSSHRYSAASQTAGGHFCIQLISNATKFTHVYTKRKLFFTQGQIQGTGFLFLNQHWENNTSYIHSTSISSVIVCFTRAKKNNFQVSVVCKPHSSQDGNFI